MIFRKKRQRKIAAEQFAKIVEWLLNEIDRLDEQISVCLRNRNGCKSEVAKHIIATVQNIIRELELYTTNPFTRLYVVPMVSDIIAVFNNNCGAIERGVFDLFHCAEEINLLKTRYEASVYHPTDRAVEFMQQCDQLNDYMMRDIHNIVHAEVEIQQSLYHLREIIVIDAIPLLMGIDIMEQRDMEERDMKLATKRGTSILTFKVYDPAKKEKKEEDEHASRRSIFRRILCRLHTVFSR